MALLTALALGGLAVGGFLAGKALRKATTAPALPEVSPVGGPVELSIGSVQERQKRRAAGRRGRSLFSGGLLFEDPLISRTRLGGG